MWSWTGKKVLIGISGGIAAYKVPLLIRLLVKEGAEVRVVQTAASKSFVTPLTLSTLSRNPVVEKLFDRETGEWTNHVELGLWADVMLVAPATANTLSKMSMGISDNLLLTTFLSARCPVIVAPAMDLDMYSHPSTVEARVRLGEQGVRVLPSDSGELASGLSGPGRMLEPERLMWELQKTLLPKPLEGKSVFITAGPTFEAIDPVRYIGNHSTGRMAAALADAAASLGAKVHMVSGPVEIHPRDPEVTCTRVMSAQQMLQASKEPFSSSDIAIFCAAVSDYRPERMSERKLKKGQDDLQRIELVENPDIAATLSAHKRDGQVCVGFALETDHAKENAQAKLERKNLDLIVLNRAGVEGQGMGSETNRITLIGRNKLDSFELKSKVDVAYDILEQITSSI